MQFRKIMLSLLFGNIALALVGLSAHAATAVKLSFITAPRSVIVGQCSSVIKVQSQDSYSNPVTLSVSKTVNLSGSGVIFYSDSYCTKMTTFKKIAAGRSVARFYIKGSQTGSPVITASALGLSSAQQTETILPSPVPTTSAPRIVPSPIYGVTIDAIDHLSDIVQSLAGLAHMPTTRIVFDEFVPASNYITAVNQIQPVSYIMGELLDSMYLRQYTMSGYQQRVNEYLNAFGSKVDIWEVGNEVNGEWLGSPSDVAAKITDAYKQVKSRGLRAAVTLYYNEDCWMYSWEEMFAWAAKNIPDYMKLGLDYVLVSYYEDDCNDLQPDWPTVFAKLGQMFPNSKIGFGETGTLYSSRKEAYINRYYNMTINQPNYVGGYFWWYFKQDMVPKTKYLWGVLNTAIQ
jgi:hypothetical protein